MGHPPRRTKSCEREESEREGPSKRHPVNPRPSVTDRSLLSPTVRWKSGDRLTRDPLTTGIHTPSSLIWRKSSRNRMSTSCHRLSAKSNPDSVVNSAASAERLKLSRPPWLAGSKDTVNRSVAITYITPAGNNVRKNKQEKKEGDTVRSSCP